MNNDTPTTTSISKPKFLRRAFITASALTVLAIVNIAPPTRAAFINFEGIPDSTSLTTQYASVGVTFSSATVITAGLSLNEIEFPPRSGSNVIVDDGGPISAVFSTPTSFFSGYFTYSSPLQITAFDSGGHLVATLNSLFSQNYTSSGNPPNEPIIINFVDGISKVVITGDPSGGSFTADDFSFSTIPEPSSVLFGLALSVPAAISLFRARTNGKSTGLRF